LNEGAAIAVKTLTIARVTRLSRSVRPR